MIDHIPPRRDPRLLVLDGRRHALLHAAIDPWELRALGRVDATRVRPLAHDLARLVLASRPSHVVLTPTAALPAAVTGLLARQGIAILALDTAHLHALTQAAPTLSELRARHAELRGLALGELGATVRLAASALVHLALPPRRYALPRLPPRAAPAVAPRRPRRDPSPPAPPPAPGRRARR